MSSASCIKFAIQNLPNSAGCLSTVHHIRIVHNYRGIRGGFREVGYDNGYAVVIQPELVGAFVQSGGDALVYFPAVAQELPHIALIELVQIAGAALILSQEVEQVQQWNRPNQQVRRLLYEIACNGNGQFRLFDVIQCFPNCPKRHILDIKVLEDAFSSDNLDVFKRFAVLLGNWVSRCGNQNNSVFFWISFCKNSLSLSTSRRLSSDKRELWPVSVFVCIYHRLLLMHSVNECLWTAWRVCEAMASVIFRSPIPCLNELFK